MLSFAGVMDMPVSVCFLSGRKISLEARLFTQAVCRYRQWNDSVLITRCASAAEMIVFEEWKKRSRPVHLILEAEIKRDDNPDQGKIIEYIGRTGGRLIVPGTGGIETTDTLTVMLQQAQWTIIMEIDRRHPVLGCAGMRERRRRTLVFQWAIPTLLNNGCAIAVSSGLASPLYPGHWHQQLNDAVDGRSNHLPAEPVQRQLEF